MEKQEPQNQCCHFTNHSEPFTTQASFSHAHLYTLVAEVKGATCSLRAIHTDTRANEMPSGAMWDSELLLKDTLTNGAGTETLTAAVVTYKLLR